MVAPKIWVYSLNMIPIKTSSQKKLTLNSVNIDRGGLKLNSTLVYSLNRNEIVELNGKEDEIAAIMKLDIQVEQEINLPGSPEDTLTEILNDDTQATTEPGDASEEPGNDEANGDNEEPTV